MLDFNNLNTERLMCWAEKKNLSDDEVFSAFYSINKEESFAQFFLIKSDNKLLHHIPSDTWEVDDFGNIKMNNKTEISEGLISIDMDNFYCFEWVTDNQGSSYWLKEYFELTDNDKEYLFGDQTDNFKGREYLEQI